MLFFGSEAHASFKSREASCRKIPGFSFGWGLREERESDEGKEREKGEKEKDKRERERDRQRQREGVREQERERERQQPVKKQLQPMSSASSRIFPTKIFSKVAFSYCILLHKAAETTSTAKVCFLLQDGPHISAHEATNHQRCIVHTAAVREQDGASRLSSA